MGYRYPNERSHRRSSLSAPAPLHNPAPPGWYQFEKNPLLQGRKFRPVTPSRCAPPLSLLEQHGIFPMSADVLDHIADRPPTDRVLSECSTSPLRFVSVNFISFFQLFLPIWRVTSTRRSAALLSIVTGHSFFLKVLIVTGRDPFPGYCHATFRLISQPRVELRR